ncbi:SusC/RagA family TonB-linked outer membrane protein [Dysgonomonas sp. Marseille-P4677]|uniref:TonB-dependent receptor n=1 Tax=Dysgonomonas sp. Marseille-P4677 TaxID=2364790 RepID=UPI0019124D6A|nr:TonB-dependent receptor [Dysgonomonas sp. Marseille-P4677]MBK5720902.1 SusC/RagA family TonB-linked outer membrane protein [Dysgonomonas sp. Marseille-P4677]
MRTFSIFLLIALTSQFICAENVYAQNLKESNITYKVKDANVKEVFNELSKLTGFHFLYEESVVKKVKPLSLNIENGSIEYILTDITRQTDLQFKKVGNTISVNRKPVVATTNAIQTKVVTGVVVDKTNVPIIGATVLEKGTTNGVTTDVDGKFSLTVQDNATLRISYIGYTSQEIKITNQTNITIRLEEDSKLLEEVVVVGYGTQKKVNLTGAVSSIDYSKESASRPLIDAAQALGGLVPGLQVMQGSGNPYGESFSMNVRGIGTLNNSNPLILVDGMEQSISNVNPIDIESISVLKDAASCAIYGNRGANGVILITTKAGGKKDKVSIEVSSKLSINSPMRVPGLVNNYADYMELINESYENLGRAAAFSDETIQLWREKAKDPNGISESGYPNYVAYPNTDWYDAIYDSQMMQEYTIQVSGSTEKSGYNFSFGYTDNPGILKDSGFKRFFVRSNVYADIAKWLRVGSRIWGYNTDRSRVSTGSLTSIDMTKVVPGTYPYYDGKYGAPESNEEDPQSHNPLWDMNHEHGDMKYTQIFTNFYTSVKFLKHLSYDFGFWYKHYIYDGKYAANAFPKWSFSLNEITANAIDLKTATTGQTYNRENYWKFNHILNYNQSFGKHDVTALLGFEQERFWSRTSNVTLQGLIDPYIDDIDVGTEYKSSYGNNSENKARSWFGRATYAYAGRYLFEVDMRGDGSSKFAPGNRWGYFPAASVGWRISEESFMDGTKDWLYNFKLRGSWGKLGNNSIGNYEWQQTYGLVNYPFNSNTNLGLAPTEQANVNLQWEKSTTTNFGLDFGILKNRLSGTIDYYNRETSGILYRPSIMMIYGNVTAARQNIAEVTNKGLEVQLTWSDRIKDFNYSVSGNFSYNKNEVSKYKGELNRGWVTDENGNRTYVTNLGDVSTGGTERVLEGHMINEYYMLQPYSGDQNYFNQDGSVNPNGGPRSGMIRTEDDMKWLNAMVDAGYKFYPNQKVDQAGIWYGDYIYADTNGDGIYGNTYDNDFTGSSSMPKWNFGIQFTASWKGFDMSMNWYGVAGNKLYFYRNGHNASTTIKGYAIGKDVADDHYFYDPANPSDPRTNLTSANPRLSNNSGSSQSESTNTKWLYDGSFLKLKNLTFGYTIPKILVRKVYADNIRFFFSGENLLTITGYPGIDPEMRASIGYLTYRQFAFGVNVTF